MVSKILLVFEDSVFKILQNAKEEAIINGEVKNWEDFIIKRILKGG